MSRLFPLKPPVKRKPHAPPSPALTAPQRQLWRDARTFQSRAQYAFREHASFFQWLLLECLQELLDETGDAVSQTAIAERAGLNKSLTSYWMVSMDEEGLVSRGPALDGRSYRICMGERGPDVLRRCAEALDAAGLRGKMLEGAAADHFGDVLEGAAADHFGDVLEGAAADHYGNTIRSVHRPTGARRR